MGRLTSMRPAIASLPSRLSRAPDQTPTDAASARKEQNRAADQARGSRHERGYGAKWGRESRAFLAKHPTCAYCAIGAFGPVRVSASSLTDHLYPQRQFDGVFWRRDLWVAACKGCHDGGKQALERQGKAALDHLAERLGRQPL